MTDGGPDMGDDSDGFTLRFIQKLPQVLFIVGYKGLKMGPIRVRNSLQKSIHIY